MLNITLPDGNKLNFEKKVTGLEVAEKISKSLLKSALLIRTYWLIDKSWFIDNTLVQEELTSTNNCFKCLEVWLVKDLIVSFHNV